MLGLFSRNSRYIVRGRTAENVLVVFGTMHYRVSNWPSAQRANLFDTNANGQWLGFDLRRTTRHSSQNLLWNCMHFARFPHCSRQFSKVAFSQFQKPKKLQQLIRK